MSLCRMVPALREEDKGPHLYPWSDLQLITNHKWKLTSLQGSLWIYTPLLRPGTMTSIRLKVLMLHFFLTLQILYVYIMNYSFVVLVDSCGFEHVCLWVYLCTLCFFFVYSSVCLLVWYYPRVLLVLLSYFVLLLLFRCLFVFSWKTGKGVDSNEREGRGIFFFWEVEGGEPSTGYIVCKTSIFNKKESN